MNYKVLYRKYRPDSFEGLVGQNHVVEILKNSIKENRIAHAYLFSGPRGTGKTSTARILAKAINCLDNKNGIACGKCANCLSFSGNPDIIEIDAASNNGVDEIRELINNIKIMPTSLKYKVYIIDEVHMLSQSAFNALLLTLEEPPEHVIFILATTNIESVPITILSRCQRFDFKRISNADLLKQLKFVCDSENILYDEEGLMEIANLADGGLRDALSILDQLSKNEEKITTDLVVREIGSISNQKIEDLVNSIANADVESFENIMQSFQENSLNYKVIIKKIIYVLSKVAVDIIKGTNGINIDYDKCKNIILDLNNLINKININVDPYLLIKITLLGYMDISSKTVSSDNKIEIKEEKAIEISEVKKEEEKVKEEPKINIDKTVEVPKNIGSSVSDKLVDIRINNCFVNASKVYLKSLQDAWKNFISNVESAVIKGLISDTMVVTASDKYAILVTTINHQELEINEKIDEIKRLFDKFNGNSYTLVFIGEAKWNQEKQKYIENLQKHYKYTYISEDIEDNSQENKDSEDELTAIAADLFDIDKIEIE